jgi:arsenate reductase
MRLKKILFVCVHNSARSQMAAAFFNQLCGGEMEATSAGLEAGKLNPYAVDVMREVGIDISGSGTRAVFDLAKRGELFAWVISVCDEAAERCPIFPGITKREAWSFRDPASFTGTDEQRREQTRLVRDEIRAAVKAFCKRECARPVAEMR